mmetsp:Transcript_20895/g.53905  ORF Transcript_20895/g.53905 Transcript_20895/m.53905 type:complete len:308 (+) Transcript_20895:927-1850(+)
MLVSLDIALIRLSHLERERIVAEAQVLGGDEAGKENVDTLAHREGHRHHAVRTGHAVEAAHEVGEVVEHAQVVLDANHVALGMQQGADAARGVQTLLDVEVRARLVEHVDLRVLHHDHADREALQLAARQVLDVALLHVDEVEHLEDRLLAFLRVVYVALVLLAQDVAHLPLHCLRDVIHVLRLDDRLEVVLEHAREEVLQLRAAKVLQDLLPVGRTLELAEVGLLLPREDLERGRLANAVGPDQSEHLARPRHRQPVQLERVGPISVRGRRLEVLWKVDDIDRLKGALLDADAAADAQLLRDPRDL